MDPFTIAVMALPFVIASQTFAISLGREYTTYGVAWKRAWRVFLLVAPFCAIIFLFGRPN
jgi:hypothetical protein